MFDYHISNEVRAQVIYELQTYPWYEKRIGELDEEILKLDYYPVQVSTYDKITVSKTNHINRATENFIIKSSEKRNLRDTYEAKMFAIRRGINRAVNTHKREDRREDLYEDLYQNMVERIPRDAFNRDTKTISKYRKRAFYFIAEELGLLKSA